MDKGHKTFGVEINSELALNLKKNGHTVFQKIEDFGEHKFDVIVLNHSLEHILNLEIELKKIIDSLSYGGQLIVLVPNYGSFWRRFFKMSWGWYQQPIHIWHFGLKGLVNLFERNGLNLKHTQFLAGDSLLVLLTLNNAFFSQGVINVAISTFSRTIINIFSIIWLKICRNFSKDEILVILKK